MIKLEPRPQASRWWTYGSPLLALGITVLMGVALFAVLGKDPVRGLQVFFWEPLRSQYALGELMVKATPLLLIALGLAVCFRSNVWNIGAEGQFVIGAVAAGGVALLADYVGVDDGTGIVHNSPGHGVDDYFACLKEGITDICMPVDDDGKFYTGEEFGTGGPFSGMDTDEANPHIIEFLRERGTLVLEKKITHSYPHCWRCKHPVLFRATDQWFVSMDQANLRSDALAAIKGVKWYPEWGEARIAGMVGALELVPNKIGRAHV